MPGYDVTCLPEVPVRCTACPAAQFVGDFILCHLQLNIRIPLPTASNLRQGTAVGQFLLSYLDDDMLIGRAENGTFIFERGS